MMIRCASLFSQILSVILDGASFERLVVKHDSDRGAKGFTSRMQLVSMLFSHLARADSLREIVTGLPALQRQVIPPWHKISTLTFNACICKYS